MKNTILYYYGLVNINITMYKDRAFIKNKDDVYIFQKIYNTKEVMQQYELTKSINEYYKFIFNKDKNLITPYNTEQYVLLKINFNKVDLMFKIFNPIVASKQDLYTPWINLWIQKCDFIEYQIVHISGKYKVIDESIDYFIGMLENAIAYLNYNLSNNTPKLYLQHKRMNEKDFYNPLNIKVDTKERDLAEYLKLSFYHEQYNINDAINMLKKIKFSRDEKIRLVARLLYPSYYFDLYEKLINNEDNEEKIKKVVLKTTEYEQFLKQIFDILNTTNDLPYIHWLNP